MKHGENKTIIYVTLEKMPLEEQKQLNFLHHFIEHLNFAPN